MKIGMIGAGNVGRALTGSATRAGHTVRVSSRDPEHSRALAGETGAQAAGSNREAVEGADVVILAVPYDAVADIVAELGHALDGKVVVDPTNRSAADDPGAVVDGSSNAEEIQNRVPAARVVKAFNTVFAARQADPLVEGMAVDGFVAGDDEQAKARTMELLESLGFRPLDTGPLSMSRALEALGWLHISLQVRNGWSWQTAWKLLGPTT